MLINDCSYNCGYVKVSDDFGDYGIVGFYAIKDNRCEHFLFSCRTLGMGIEQYTFNYLNNFNQIGTKRTGPVVPILPELNMFLIFIFQLLQSIFNANIKIINFFNFIVFNSILNFIIFF